MDELARDATVTACKDLIAERFPGEPAGAAAVLLADGDLPPPDGGFTHRNPASHTKDGV